MLCLNQHGSLNVGVNLLRIHLTCAHEQQLVTQEIHVFFLNTYNLALLWFQGSNIHVKIYLILWMSLASNPLQAGQSLHSIQKKDWRFLIFWSLSGSLFDVAKIVSEILKDSLPRVFSFRSISYISRCPATANSIWHIIQHSVRSTDRSLIG